MPNDNTPALVTCLIGAQVVVQFGQKDAEGKTPEAFDGVITAIWHNKVDKQDSAFPAFLVTIPDGRLLPASYDRIRVKRLPTMPQTVSIGDVIQQSGGRQ